MIVTVENYLLEMIVHLRSGDIFPQLEREEKNCQFIVWKRGKQNSYSPSEISEKKKATFGLFR